MSVQPEGRFAEVGGGLKIHYRDEGKGAPVLFLHGSGPGAGGHSNFKENYPYFVERGRRVLVPDTLGYGHSSKPDDIDYTLDYLVGSLVRFLDSLGIEQCAVIGNSHGGAMAIQLALSHPGRVSKLVLMAPGGLEVRERYMEMEGIRAMVKAVLGSQGITREGMRRVFELQLHDSKLITEQLIEERLAIARTQPKRVLTSMQVPHLAPRLKEIECPVLGLWGTEDKFCPVSGALALAQGCRRSRVLLLSQCGHWVMVEQRDLFNRLCNDFLDEGPAQ